jgi:hypothetical protein
MDKLILMMALKWVGREAEKMNRRRRSWYRLGHHSHPKEIYMAIKL